MPKYLFSICLFFFTAPFFSQAQRIETQVNKAQLLSSEVLKFTITVRNRRAPETPVFPELEGFVKGPTSLAPISRGSSRTYTYSQIYYPHVIGAFIVPRIPIYIAGKKYSTKKIEGKVEKDEEVADSFEEELFPAKLIVLTDSLNTRVGQAFRVQLGISVTKGDFQKFSIPDRSYFQKKLLDQVDKNLFEVVPVPVKELGKLELQNGEDSFYLMASMFLLPKKEGTFALPHFSLSLKKQWNKAKATKKEKENYLHLRYYPTVFRTDSKKIQVNELPKTHLPLSKTIGEFQIQDSLNKESYLCGESIKLTIHITGNGNLQAIPRPTLKIPENFLLYDPVSSLEIIPDTKQIKGRKTFVYELIAAYPGGYTIPPVSMYFFNPQIGDYDSTRIDSIFLSIQGESIPQLLEINVLHNFYRDAFSQSANTPSFQIPYLSKLIIGLSVLSVLLLTLSFYRPGKKIFGNRHPVKVLSPGLKKLVENKKG